MFTLYQQCKDLVSYYTTIQPTHCGTKPHFCSNELCIPLTRLDSSAASTLVTLTPLVSQYVYTSPEHAQNAAVVRLDWFKYTEGLEHEYIVATLVRKDDDRNKYYLRFEQRAARHENVCEKNMLKEENIKSLSPEHQSQFLKDVLLEKNTIRRVRWKPAGNVRWQRGTSSKENDPRGEITWRRILSSNGITRDDPGNVYLLASYEFTSSSSKPLSFRDLVFLVEVIKKKSEEGEKQQASIRQKPLMEQSFWFSRTCMGVVKKRCALDELTEATLHRNTTAGTYWVGKSDYFWSRSQTNRLTVNEDDAEQIVELERTFDAKIQENDEYLQRKYMDREGARLEAQKTQEEAEQITKETQQRILELQQSLGELKQHYREENERMRQQIEKHRRGVGRAEERIQ